MQPREFHYLSFKVKARERLRAFVTGQSTLVKLNRASLTTTATSSVEALKPTMHDRFN
jgi:hypothetical protein